MTRLIKRMVALGFSLCLAAPSLAFAVQPPEPAANPVEQASFHQLVFADEDVAILNNLYPPKGDSGFHAHHRDLFAVVVQPSPSSGQRVGEPLTAMPASSAGTTAYSQVGAEPRIHRVVNDGEGVFQIIVIELRRATPSGTSTSSRDLAPQYKLILDNPRLRAWRLVLAPGESAPAVSQSNKGVRVVVRGGLLTTIAPGLQDQQLALRPGDFAVQAAGTTRALRNGGDGTIELVEVELK
jgi:mannose-6-phosphate isomerase-like protein (cupin superfamily)